MDFIRAMKQKPGSRLLHTVTIYRLDINIHFFFLEVTMFWLNFKQLLTYLLIGNSSVVYYHLIARITWIYWINRDSWENLRLNTWIQHFAAFVLIFTICYILDSIQVGIKIASIVESILKYVLQKLCLRIIWSTLLGTTEPPMDSIQKNKSLSWPQMLFLDTIVLLNVSTL